MNALYKTLSYRTDLRETDLENVKEIVTSTHFFDEAPDEIDVALELVQTALDGGNNTDNYAFLFAMDGDKTVGYACYARVPCTVSTFEIYWLGVHNDVRSKGIGKELMHRVIDAVKAEGALKVVLETAGREQYVPTQKFYIACGFKLEARLVNYYTKGDDCLIYSMDF